MADQSGAIKFPPDPPTNNPIADPLVRKLGEYLATYINATLSRDWSKVVPGSPKPVRDVHEANAVRSAFNIANLPELFVSRHITTPEKIADDLWWDINDIYVVWLPPLGEQVQREQRDPFSSRIAKAIKHAVQIGRHPYWVDAGDASDSSATLGSVLAERLVLVRPPRVKRIEFDPPIRVVIGDEPVQFDGVLVHVECVELNTLDPAIRGVPSKSTTTISQGSPGGDGDNHAGDHKVVRTYQ